MHYFTRLATAAIFLLPAFTYAKTNLSVQDVDFTTAQQDGRTTVRAKVVLQKDQWEKFDRKDKQVEIRFYVGKSKDNAPRIMKSETYYLNNRISSYTFRPTEACTSEGTYYAKIWLSVRHANGKPDDSYETYQQFYSYSCPGREPKSINATASYKLADEQRWGLYNQLNLIVNVNDQQYSQVTRDNRKFEVAMYVYRDDERYKFGKTYFIDTENGKDSFTYPIRELCGEMNSFLDFILDKEVVTGCTVRVVNQDGSPDYRYKTFACQNQTFVCH